MCMLPDACITSPVVRTSMSGVHFGTVMATRGPVTKISIFNNFNGLLWGLHFNYFVQRGLVVLSWLQLLLVFLRAARNYRRQVRVPARNDTFSSLPCRRRPGSRTAGPGPAIFDPFSLLRPDGSRLRPRNWYSWL